MKYKLKWIKPLQNQSEQLGEYMFAPWRFCPNLDEDTGLIRVFTDHYTCKLANEMTEFFKWILANFEFFLTLVMSFLEVVHRLGRCTAKLPSFWKGDYQSQFPPLLSWRQLFWKGARYEGYSSWFVWMECPHVWGPLPRIHRADQHWWRRKIEDVNWCRLSGPVVNHGIIW